ncbi:helix-turn-helix domain-containing protein [Pseudoxanthomonas yeongjuensis]|uniref:helix-turn-helix transcriptional regulator n=1 Tax=Pseudoxanthomonas yeongjuensis TaxID=377616 RepID=UPI0013919287
MQDEFLTTREAAALTKMSAAWYEKARWQKRGPPFLRKGRAVRYLRSELMNWWTENPDQ